MAAPLDDAASGPNEAAMAGAYQSLPLETRVALLAGDSKARAELNRAYARFATAQPNRKQRRAHARTEITRARAGR